MRIVWKRRFVGALRGGTNSVCGARSKERIYTGQKKPVLFKE